MRSEHDRDWQPAQSRAIADGRTARRVYSVTALNQLEWRDMETYLVLTVIGDDRPGLVEALAETIAAHEGNWLESRMSHLAGKFAGLLRVSVPASRFEALRAALSGLEARGLSVVSAPGGEEAGASREVRLELVGTDHPGIVRDISTALAHRKVNVEELSTETVDAPMSGQPLFRAVARLHLPAEASVDELRGDLEAVADDLMVDVSILE
jgi:glycine cleavage system regulatory protein